MAISATLLGGALTTSVASASILAPSISETHSTSATKSLKVNINVKDTGVQNNKITSVKITSSNFSKVLYGNSKPDTGTKNLSTSVTLTKNGTYVIEAKNAKGQVSKKTIVITNIDTVAPKYVDHTVSKDKKTLTVKISENDKMKSSTANGKVGHGTKVGSYHYGVIPINGKGTYTIKLTDEAGNTSTKTITVK